MNAKTVETIAVRLFGLYRQGLAPSASFLAALSDQLQDIADAAAPFIMQRFSEMDPPKNWPLTARNFGIEWRAKHRRENQSQRKGCEICGFTGWIHFIGFWDYEIIRSGKVAQTRRWYVMTALCGHCTAGGSGSGTVKVLSRRDLEERGFEWVLPQAANARWKEYLDFQREQTQLSEESAALARDAMLHAAAMGETGVYPENYERRTA